MKKMLTRKLSKWVTIMTITGNQLDFAYFKQNYKLIAIDLSKQTKFKNSNRLILLENLKTKIMKQQCFSLSKNQKKQL